MTFGNLMVGVALPDTLLEERGTLRDKTVKLGQIARSCSIYGVDSILVFRDPAGKGEPDLIRKILTYLETPQYLRKQLFGYDEALRFAGLLPPLRIPSHKPKVPVSGLRLGEFREGVVLEDGKRAYIGLDSDLRLASPGTPGERVTVRVLRAVPPEGIAVPRSETGEYWGYSVEVLSIGSALAGPRFELKLATSRAGDPLSAVLGSLVNRLSGARSTLFLFGSPTRGLFEMVGPGLRGKVDFVLNFFEHQNVVTVRTEEALASAMALLNVMTAMKGQV